MNFDTLISLLIFILFIGLPLLNRLRGRGRTGGARPRTGRQAPTRPTAQQAPTRPTAQQAPPPATQADDGDPIAQRLEEARRRVQEALDRQETSARPTQAPTQAATQAATQAPPPTAIPGSQPAPILGVPASIGRPPNLEVPPPFIPRTPSKALEVERRPRKVRKTARARMEEQAQEEAARSLEAIVSHEPRDIVAGIVWHQILKEPKARQWLPRRRNASQPPLP